MIIPMATLFHMAMITTYGRRCQTEDFKLRLSVFSRGGALGAMQVIENTPSLTERKFEHR